MSVFQYGAHLIKTLNRPNVVNGEDALWQTSYLNDLEQHKNSMLDVISRTFSVKSRSHATNIVSQTYDQCKTRAHTPAIVSNC